MANGYYSPFSGEQVDAAVAGYLGTVAPRIEIDSTHTTAVIPVLSGGVSYRYTQPLTALTVEEFTNSPYETQILFTAGANFTPSLPPVFTIIVPADTTVANGSSYLFSIKGDILRVDKVVRPVVVSAGVVTMSKGVTINVANLVEREVINSGTSQYVYTGGTVSSATVNPKGSMYVLSGGSAYNILENGGYVSVAPNATVTFIPNSVSPLTIGYQQSATFHVSNTLSRVTVNSAGWLSIEGLHNSVTNLTVLQGGSFNITEPNLDFNPHDFSVILGSNINIPEGCFYYNNLPVQGYASNGVFYNLSGVYRLGIGSGASAIGAILENNSTKARLYIFSGGYANNISVGKWGDIDIYPGGVAENISLGGYAGGRSQCELTVWGDSRLSATASAHNATAYSNSLINVISGGTLTGNVQVYSGASVRVYSSRSYVDTINLHSGGVGLVSGGGLVNSAIISGGTIWIRSTTVNSITLSGLDSPLKPSVNITSTTINNLSLGYMAAAVLNNCSVTTLKQSGGFVIAKQRSVISNAQVAGSDFVLSSGGTGINIVAVVGSGVYPKKKISISSGGVLSGLSVLDVGTQGNGITDITNQYGSVVVLSSGYLQDVTFTNIRVSKGGVVSGVTPQKVFSGAGVACAPAYVGSLHVYSGGTALGIRAADGFIVSSAPGAVVSYTQD